MDRRRASKGHRCDEVADWREAMGARERGIPLPAISRTGQQLGPKSRKVLYTKLTKDFRDTQREFEDRLSGALAFRADDDQHTHFRLSTPSRLFSRIAIYESHKQIQVSLIHCDLQARCQICPRIMKSSCMSTFRAKSGRYRIEEASMRTAFFKAIVAVLRHVL